MIHALLIAAAVTIGCGQRDQVLLYLKAQYGEEPVGNGLMLRPEIVVEFTYSEAGKTWSMLFTDPATKISCIAMAGVKWRWIVPPGEKA